MNIVTKVEQFTYLNLCVFVCVVSEGGEQANDCALAISMK